MIKYCPIMSFQKERHNEERCMEEICAFWDEENGQCCLKSAALAVAGKKSGGSSAPMQVEHIYNYTSPTIAPSHSNSYEVISSGGRTELADQYLSNGEWRVVI